MTLIGGVPDGRFALKDRYGGEVPYLVSYAGQRIDSASDTPLMPARECAGEDSRLSLELDPATPSQNIADYSGTLTLLLTPS